MSLPVCASVGRVRRPHGVRGELVVELFTDAPDAIFASGRRLFQGTQEGALYLDPRTKAPRALTVKQMRPFKEGILLFVEEITDRTESERWNGRHLLVPESELTMPDEGELFEHELIGMQLVDDATDEALGAIVEVYDLPQGLLLEFETGEGLASIPFIDEFVVDVDRETRVIRVAPPAGLLDPASERDAESDSDAASGTA